MPEKFDPYRKWLGIPPAEQPPHHYRLLGIAVFEDDPDVIAYSADRQMSHVRKFQSGKNGDYAQRLMSELAQARRCLLAAKEKADYDAKLRKALGVKPSMATATPLPSRPRPAPAPPPPQSTPPEPAPPQSAPPVATMEPAVVRPVAVASSPAAGPSVRTRPVTSRSRRSRKKNNAVPMVAALVALAGLAVIVLVVALTLSTEMESEPSSQSTNNNNASRSPVAVDTSDDEKRESAPPTRSSQPDPPQSVAPTTAETEDAGTPPPPANEPPAGPNDQSGSDAQSDSEAQSSSDPSDATSPTGTQPSSAPNFDAAAKAAEDAMETRDVATAARHLLRAEELDSTVREQIQLATLKELQRQLREFWRAVERGLADLQPDDELSFGGKTAEFVAVSGDDLTLSIAGNKTTQSLTEWAPQYLVAIAQQGIDEADAQSKLALATFLALDRNARDEAQLEQAKTLYAEAVAGGITSEALADHLQTEPAPALPAPGGN